jgi:hypothetical protein
VAHSFFLAHHVDGQEARDLQQMRVTVQFAVLEVFEEAIHDAATALLASREEGESGVINPADPGAAMESGVGIADASASFAEPAAKPGAAVASSAALASSAVQAGAAAASSAELAAMSTSGGVVAGAIAPAAAGAAAAAAHDAAAPSGGVSSKPLSS